jgi:hypothetical protein
MRSAGFRGFWGSSRHCGCHHPSVFSQKTKGLRRMKDDLLYKASKSKPLTQWKGITALAAQALRSPVTKTLRGPLLTRKWCWVLAVGTIVLVSKESKTLWSSDNHLQSISISETYSFWKNKVRPLPPPKNLKRKSKKSDIDPYIVKNVRGTSIWNLDHEIYFISIIKKAN